MSPPTEVVLRIRNRDGQPLVDAAFLTSLMQGMAKRDDTGMEWSITVNGRSYARTGEWLTPEEMVVALDDARLLKQPRWLVERLRRRWHRSEQVVVTADIERAIDQVNQGEIVYRRRPRRDEREHRSEQEH